MRRVLGWALPLSHIGGRDAAPGANLSMTCAGVRDRDVDPG